MVSHSTFYAFIGTTFGGYRLEELIGQNELGPVFLGRTNEGAKYLLRFLTAPAELDPEARILYLGKFQQLANQIAELQQRNILPLLDYNTYQGMPYLVTPGMPMQTLIAAIAQRGLPDSQTIGRYLDEIALALEYAHEHAIIHRNLSTDCVFILRDGRLVVGDFGVMRMLELLQPAGGKYPSYGSGEGRAPEQLEGKPIDTYTDVYALGAILYRLLTAHAVFKGGAREEIAQQHLQAPVPSLSKWRRDLPPQLDAIIGKAMAKEPARRFARPSELVAAYHEVVFSADTHKIVIAANPVPQDKRTAVPSAQSGRAGPGEPRKEKMETTGDALEWLDSAPNAKGASQVQGGRSGQASRSFLQALNGADRDAMSRRRALVSLAAGGSIVVVGAALAIAHFAQPAVTGATQPTGGASPGASTPTRGKVTGNQTVLAHAQNIPLDSAVTFPLAASAHPGLLIHLPDNRFVAFDSTCTHAGCAVDYVPQTHLLKCPCHNAIFDPARGAAVVQGPAPTPLAPIKITVNADGTITRA